MPLLLFLESLRPLRSTSASEEPVLDLRELLSDTPRGLLLDPFLEPLLDLDPLLLLKLSLPALSLPPFLGSCALFLFF